VHDLALNRKLAGRRLPEGSAVVSAINAGEEYQVTDLDPALASRFNIYELSPEVDEWIAWAKKNGVDRRIVAFIEQSSVHLEQSGESGDPLDKTPDRRAWVRVSQLITGRPTITPTLLKAVAGIVGAPAAAAFSKFLGDKQRINPEDVLLRLDDKLAAVIKTTSVQDLVYLNRQVLQYIEDQEDKPNAAKRKKIAAGAERYLELLKSGKQTEIVADFINQTERDDFRKASTLLISTPSIMRLMEDFMQKVKL
jgi:hypothetical protein